MDFRQDFVSTKGTGAWYRDELVSFEVETGRWDAELDDIAEL